jgi:hypothetical protein
MVGVVGEHGSAEQQDQSQSLHRRVSLRLLFIMKTVPGLQAGGDPPAGRFARMSREPLE